jgi:hypothetical protein
MDWEPMEETLYEWKQPGAGEDLLAAATHPRLLMPLIRPNVTRTHTDNTVSSFR